MGKKFLYNRVEEAIIPAGKEGRFYKNKDWEKTTIAANKNYLIYKSNSNQGYIPLHKIFYLDRKVNYSRADASNVLNFNYQTDEGVHFAVIKTPYKDYLKKTILTATISDIVIYFISPYQTGGRIYTDKDWQKGIFQFTGNSIKIWDTNKEIINEISERRIFRVDSDKIKGYEAIKIFYERDDEELADLLFSPKVSLAILRDFFKEVLLKSKGQEAALNDEERDIMMAIETGINSSSEIAELMELEHDEILNYLDALKDKGIIKVIGTEKIVDLTSSGKQKLESSMQ